jgi:hypothetical protein
MILFTQFFYFKKTQFIEINFYHFNSNYNLSFPFKLTFIIHL